MYSTTNSFPHIYSTSNSFLHIHSATNSFLHIYNTTNNFLQRNQQFSTHIQHKSTAFHTYTAHLTVFQTYTAQSTVYYIFTTQPTVFHTYTAWPIVFYTYTAQPTVFYTYTAQSTVFHRYIEYKPKLITHHKISVHVAGQILFAQWTSLLSTYPNTQLLTNPFQQLLLLQKPAGHHQSSVCITQADKAALILFTHTVNHMLYTWLFIIKRMFRPKRIFQQCLLQSVLVHLFFFFSSPDEH